MKNLVDGIALDHAIRAIGEHLIDQHVRDAFADITFVPKTACDAVMTVA